MSVKKIYKLQKQIKMLKDKMILHFLGCNLNEVMRHSIPANLVLVEYASVYNHYFQGSDLISYLDCLCEYYCVDILWYEVDFDNTLVVSTVEKKHFQEFNKKVVQ